MVSLTENLQRRDLNAIEKARGLTKLIEKVPPETGTGRKADRHVPICNRARFASAATHTASTKSYRARHSAMGYGKLLAEITDADLSAELGVEMRLGRRVSVSRA